MAINEGNDFPFTIRIDFWEVLVNDINRFATVLNGCYQSYRDELQQNDDSHHLACLRVAFDRPAFKDDFLHERNFDDFEEALVTTKRLFRTGFAKDRWSQIPIVQTVPVEFLPDGPYRKFVIKIEGLLEKAYKAYIAKKPRILHDHRYAKDQAGNFNILRRDLLVTLNTKLSEFKLEPIPFDYA